MAFLQNLTHFADHAPKMSYNSDHGMENFTKCNDAILDSEFKSDVYVNVSSAVARFASNCFIHYRLLALAVILVLVLYAAYKVYWDPICYVKELTEVGFEHIPPGPYRERHIARAQATRRMGSRIPPPYPNGWFVVAESVELRVGGVMSVDVLGQNLCVYRGEDGKARCVDAYCPHLGANLAIGGSVCGTCIECPFHKWKFDGDGACVSVPNVENAPKGVNIKTWTTVEADGAVWIWHDAEGRAPMWRLTDAPECQQWAYRGRNEFFVSAHIQEIPENGSDVAHLNAVHSPSLMSALGEKYPFLEKIIGRHVWNATWTRNEDHTATMTLTHDYKILKYEFFHVVLTITQIGPGHVRLRMQTPAGPLLLSQSVTPHGPLLQRVVHRVFSPVYNAPLARYIIISEGKMIERDIKIWNSKRFVSTPTYVKTDKTIKMFRNWYAQFYTDHSVGFRESLQNPLDW